MQGLYMLRLICFVFQFSECETFTLRKKKTILSSEMHCRFVSNKPVVQNQTVSLCVLLDIVTVC